VIDRRAFLRVASAGGALVAGIEPGFAQHLTAFNADLEFFRLTFVTSRDG
jgi:hypothetical protein